jgi:hypothetical protein
LYESLWLPILVILGIDEYKLSQLFAFALIRDRMIKQFVDVLTWFRGHLSLEGGASPEQTSRAFVVDRHDTQLAALQKVFPKSRIVFCSKHLGANIRRAMGNHSKVLVAFWELMHGKIIEEQFVATLKVESTIHQDESPQQRMLTFLSMNLDHFSPRRVWDDISEQASSRVEGFFRAYKNTTHHEIVPLATAVKGIRVLGHTALERRSPVSIPHLPPEIMSISDQKKFGFFAAITI